MIDKGDHFDSIACKRLILSEIVHCTTTRSLIIVYSNKKSEDKAEKRRKGQ